MKERIPQKMPARTLDMANHAMSSVFVPQIHLILDFDGVVDPDRMKRALRLLMDAEPVLGCRFVPRWIRPYWQRLPEEEIDGAEFFHVKNSSPAEQDILQKEFLAKDLDSVKGPQIEVLLLSGEEGDRLLVKIRHEVADGGGTKELAYLLSSIYRKLAKNSAYRPEVNNGSRSLRQIYKGFNFRQKLLILRKYFQEMKQNFFPYQSLQYPSGTKNGGSPVFVFRDINRQRMREVVRYCGENGVTINDLVVTAMVRAIARQVEYNGSGQLRLIGTVDLRRYLTARKGDGVCNLSSFFFTNLGTELGERFEDTLTRIKEQIDASKENYLGLGFLLGSYVTTLPCPYAVIPAMAKKMYGDMARKGNMMPGLTNLGEISDRLLDFGSPVVKHCEMTVPASCPPFFVVGLSGFGGTLTFSAGIFDKAIQPHRVEKLFALVEEELPG